jgi:hypothetical protein
MGLWRWGGGLFILSAGAGGVWEGVGRAWTGAGDDGFKGAFCPKAEHSLRGSRSPLMFPLGCEFDPELLGGAAGQVETAPDR